MKAEPNDIQPNTAGSQEEPRTVHFICNGLFSTDIGGGDIYTRQMARALEGTPYKINFIGGHALKHFINEQRIQADITLTDKRISITGNPTNLTGQWLLLFDFIKRLLNTLRRLSVISTRDIAYATSDFLFDTIPLFFCRAPRKIVYLGMTAPSFAEVLFRTRPDVTSVRLNSIYYWLSQKIALHLVKRMKNCTVTYGHPDIKTYLLSKGFRESSLVYVANGIDFDVAKNVEAPPVKYDAVWIGRIHPQKGIDDLMNTLLHLAKSIPDFTALIIGSAEPQLRPMAEQLGISQNITFSGRVSETDKFRLLKSCRVFLMPSHYESWGIVIGEALACGLEVVAYDLAAYRPIFQESLHYVKPFDLSEFCRQAENMITMQRRDYHLPTHTITNSQIDWKLSRMRFVELIRRP